MPPDGVDKRYVNLAKRFAAAKPAVHFVMQDDVVTKPNHGVAWVALRECAADNHVTRLNSFEANFVKSISCHILQVEVFTAHPPTTGSLEVGQINTAQVVGIAKQRVAIHHAMFEPASQQMRPRKQFS